MCFSSSGAREIIVDVEVVALMFQVQRQADHHQQHKHHQCERVLKYDASHIPCDGIEAKLSIMGALTPGMAQTIEVGDREDGLGVV
eukprot:scaffold15569_cov35-Cyclotella_meneghiniana.AAC.1